MKTAYIVCLVVCGAAALIAVACALFAVVSKKSRKGASVAAKAALAVLGAALIAVAVTGAAYTAGLEKRVKNSLSPNRVNIGSPGDDVFSGYLGAESIPGYTAQTVVSGDVRFTCHVRDAESDKIMPDFVVFAEYVGEAPSEDLYWGAVKAELKRNGAAVDILFVSGDHHSDAMIFTGVREADVNELYILIDLCPNGKFAQESVSLTLTD